MLTKAAFNGSDTALLRRLVPEAAAAAGNARSLPQHPPKPAEPRRSTVLLAGCEAHLCVPQTAFLLLEQEELDVVVVADACGSRWERDRDAAFDHLAAEGITLVTTKMVGSSGGAARGRPRARIGKRPP